MTCKRDVGDMNRGSKGGRRLLLITLKVLKRRLGEFRLMDR